MNERDKEVSYADWFYHSMFGYPYPPKEQPPLPQQSIPSEPGRQ